MKKSIKGIGRKERLTVSILAFLVVAVMVFGLLPQNSKAAEDKVADPSTTQNWNQDGALTNDTRNVGRIWTDKTVSAEDIVLKGTTDNVTIGKGDSDFLVALSAMSSSMTIKGTETRAIPLDIVLVLDTSGSMGKPVQGADDSRNYTALGNDEKPDENEIYHVQLKSGDQTVFQPIVYVTAKKNSQAQEEQFWAFRTNVNQNENYYDPNGNWVKVEKGNNDFTTTGSNANYSNLKFFKANTNTKLSELKIAANNFIDATARENETLDAEDQHRISIIQFGTKTNLRNNLTPCIGDDNLEVLHGSVNGLLPGGGTVADSAMAGVAEQLKTARPNADKVVIFFTDGEPTLTTGSTFSPETAKKAIAQGATLKANNTKIYTIGMWKDADPNANPVTAPTTNAENFNAYMHGLSSNYPKASDINSLGNRVPDSKFYKSATNVGELDDIFQEILAEIIVEPAKYPTIIEGNDPSESGYITFTDELGPYMQVDGFKEILFANDVFREVRKGDPEKTATGELTTYTFTGTGGGQNGFPFADLTDIKITVESFTAPEKGDKVTIKIPASAIPMRHYTVNLDGDENSENKYLEIDDVYPGRIFYGVSLKDGTKGLIARPDPAMAKYMQDNTEGGKVPFYSNNYIKGDEDKGETNSALTNSQFTPALTNDFYYFQEDTKLFTDEACTQEAAGEIDTIGNTTYYYQRSYYAATGIQTSVIEIPGNSPLVLDDFVEKDSDGKLYIPEGAPRATALMQFNKDKEENKTNTAPYAINPGWEKTSETLPAGETRDIITALGNNGRYSIDLPGELDITKNAVVPYGLTGPTKRVTEGGESKIVSALDDQEFKMSLTLKDNDGNVLTGKYASQIFDGDNDPVEGTNKDIVSGDTITLKNEQTIHIYGLPTRATYEVKETIMPDGFTQTKVKNTCKGETSENEGANKPASGEIIGGQIAQAEFTNTYSADPVTLNGSDNFKTEKVYADGDIAPGAFTFIITGSTGAPMPEETHLTFNSSEFNSNNDSSMKSFGDIEFNKEGEYIYTIEEATPQRNDRVPGIIYSDAEYQVTVSVVDNGSGKLEIASCTMNQIKDDSANDVTGHPVVNDKTATITNVFKAEEVKPSITAFKAYTDNSGGNPLTADKFTFSLKPVSKSDAAAPDAPMPNIASGSGGSEATVGNKIDGDVIFGNVTFGAEHVSYSYIYEISEVIPQEAANNGNQYNGMTYDANKYYVKFDISHHKKDNGEDTAIVVFDKTYYENFTPGTDGVGGSCTDELKANQLGGHIQDGPKFVNTYDVTPVTIPNTTVSMLGKKKLTGRDMQEGETFNFIITAFDDATTSALNNNTVVFDDDEDKKSITASVTGLKNGDIEPIKNFGKITFSKIGTYTFGMKEVLPEGAENKNTYNGMSYDRRTCIVTVEVTDKKGQLEAKITKYTGKDLIFTFENKYESSGTYSGLNVVKLLQGRETGLKNGEFNFTIRKDDIEGNENVPDVPQTDASFSNPTSNSGKYWRRTMRGKLSSLEFTQADAGKTYTYILDEADPVFLTDPTDPDSATQNDDNENLEGLQKDGVTYDQSQYKIEITVVDNNDGTLHTITKVTKIKDENGNDTSQVIGEYNSSEGQTAAPEFTNKYEAVPAEFDITEAKAYFAKHFEGRTWGADEPFSFTIKAHNDTPNAPMPYKGGTTNTEATVKGSDAATHDGYNGPVAVFGFGTMTFDKPGTYKYVVTEKLPEDDNSTKAGIQKDGVTYDSHQAVLTVTVTDDGNGNLVATGSVADNLFSNVYEVADINFSDSVDINITKKLTGRDMNENQFEFMYKPVDQASATKAGISVTGETLKNNSGADGVAVPIKNIINNINITKADVGKTYSYEIYETTQSHDGYTCDTNRYKISYTVQDDGDGTLSIKAEIFNKGSETAEYNKFSEVTIDGTGDKEQITIPFENSYTVNTPTANVTVNASKTLTGRPLKDKEFTFAVKPITEQADDVATAENDANGNITFTLPRYTIESLKQAVKDGYATKTREKGELKDVYKLLYTAYEKTAGLPGVGLTPSDKTFNFTVKVTDDGKGNLTVTEIKLPENGIEFENTYSTGDPVALKIKGRKILNASEGLSAPTLEGGEFSFAIAADATTPDAPLPEVKEVKNDNLGNVEFGDIKYNLDLLKDVTPNNAGERIREFKYNITETESGYMAGVTNEKAPKTVTVTLKDDGKGTLSTLTATTGINGADFTFINTYSVEPEASSVTDDITILKSLTGRDLRDKEFTFAISAVTENAPLPTVKTATNDANGKVTFDKMTYTKPGTYVYKIKEVSGDANNGIEYDNNEYQVIATVTDNHDGKLNVTHKLNGGGNEIEFKNSYVPGSTSITIGASKTLTGRDLRDEEFSFTISAETDKAPLPDVTTVTNDANGLISFGPITYNSTGTYKYTIREDNSNPQDNIIYDNNVKTVTVSVTDDGSGTLKAEITNGSSPSFTNTYVVPATVNLNGLKILEDSGMTPPDITGKYTFKIEPKTKAGFTPPEPSKTEAKNDKDGKVDFGTVNFPLSILDGVKDDDGDGIISKTFEYKVTENGKVEGITNDKDAVKTIKITLEYDKENGTLTATPNGAAALFTFTNIYNPPTVPGGPDNPGDSNNPGGSDGSDNPDRGTKTGDEFNLGLMLAIMCIAGAAAVGTVIFGRRKRSH